jgi:hypothetical protein
LSESGNDVDGDFAGRQGVGLSKGDTRLDIRSALNKIVRMPPLALPPDFEESRDAGPEDLKLLPSITIEAVHVLERCMAEHHIAEVDYAEPDERQETIRIRPAFIRTSKALNLVAWGFPVGADHWIELRLDRIRAVRDTGEVFQPSW